MQALLILLWPIERLNSALLGLGRGIAVVALALMVAVILLQVVCRYLLNNALPWPDEAARFLMLWMTGLAAPSAYRRGGFVAIDMVSRFMPALLAGLLALSLLLISGAVLAMGLELGHKHVMSGCLFKSASLWLPFKLSFALPLPGLDMSLTLCTRADAALGLDWGWVKMPLALMYASLLVGVFLLLLVNIELILRSLITLLGGETRLTQFHHIAPGAE
ncbi:MAG: TRAP transporter small permease [Mangrovicoccus sp.]